MAKTLVYQLYPSSWPQGLSGMTEHLHRIASLGVDYVWLSPIYRSSGYDGGYDISDYRSIAIKYGTMANFDHFVETAHSLGIGVLMDLVLNHTSTSHKWFGSRPEYYCWSPYDRPDWHNLFNYGPAWRYVEEFDEYYLHLFHEEQADLNWFPGGELNHDLVQEFRDIVDFWVNGHLVDGFRLDVPQAINKDFARDTLEFPDLIYGSRAAEVINAVFPIGGQSTFLMMECFDPTMGDIVDYYTTETQVDFVLNVLLKDEIENSELDLYDSIKYLTRNKHFMLDLESHDSPRFPSRGISPEDEFWYMFNSRAEGVCLYQGQELGLHNPSMEELSDEMMLILDVQSAMQFIKGERVDALRPHSRANARVPLPLTEYDKQDLDPRSYFNLIKDWIARWRDDEDD